MDSKPKIEFNKSLVSSTVEVIAKQFNTTCIAEQLEPKTANFSNAGIDITATLDFFGKNLHGSISLCFPKQTFLNLMEIMFKENLSDITVDTKDGAGELANIIFGLTKSQLNNQFQYEIKKSLPKVTFGDSVKVEGYNSHPIVILPFTTGCGLFHIELSFEE